MGLSGDVCTKRDISALVCYAYQVDHTCSFENPTLDIGKSLKTFSLCRLLSYTRDRKLRRVLMTQDTSTKISNKILAALPAKEYQRLLPDLEHVPLSLGNVLYETDDEIHHVYFPSASVVSLVKHMKKGASVEVGIIGREGMVGVSVVLGDGISSNQAIVQIADGAMQLSVVALKKELSQGGQLQPLLLRFTQSLLRQVSQTAACNRTHNIGERLARWLLTTQDRVDSNELALTQEFIAEMLGTRRSGVTEAAIILQDRGLISYVRGHITILNREGLEAFACECYEDVKNDFNRLSAD
jgi:CRP-like cAMP-binding protein